MVVFLELGDDDASDPFARSRVLPGLQKPLHSDHESATVSPNHNRGKEDESTEEERPNPNLNTFSKALGCYP